MWQKLHSIHEQQNQSNKLTLMTKFHEYKMATNDIVTQHIAKVKNMARQLKDLREGVSDFTIMAKILGSLPSKFSALVTAWDSVDVDKQTLQGLSKRLIKEENRMSISEDSTSALTVKSKNKSHVGSKAPHKPAQQNWKPVKCFYCHKKGHFASVCREKKRDLQKKKQPRDLQKEEKI